MKSIIADYSFQTNGDISRGLGSLITPILKLGGFINGSVPMEIVEANDSQTGKGYFVLLRAALYGEMPIYVAAKKGGVGSLDESFASALIKARPFIVIDNYREKLDSQYVESFLTAQGQFSVRVPHAGELYIDPSRFFSVQLEMLAQFHRHRLERMDESKKELDRVTDALFPRLAELGVWSVVVKCEGGGDQGEIVSIDLKTFEGTTAPSLDETECGGKTLRELIEDTAYLTLFVDHPGWEQNAGSDSTFRLDPFYRKVWCERFLPLEEADFEEDGDDENDGEKDEE